MARIFYTADGTILRVNRSPAMAIADPSVVQVLDIDEGANGPVVDALLSSGLTDYKVVGAALQRKGVAVPLSFDANARAIDTAFDTLKAKILSGGVLALGDVFIIVRWLVRRELARIAAGQ